jgi:hypothetical protein
MQFGRCAVNKFFDKALDLLRQNQDLFSTFVEHKIGFDQADEVGLFRTIYLNHLVLHVV